MMDRQVRRCFWAGHSQEEQVYHDAEWGSPVRDDLRWFEFLLLESAQAGLSWLTILRKRHGYRDAFEGFDPAKVAAFDSRKLGELLANPGIVRNRAKLQSAIGNARAFLTVQEGFGSFNDYIWRFVDGAPIQNAWTCHSAIPAHTDLAICLSKDLKKRGFRFVGPTICYAFMQATGMVNDHTVECYRWQQLREGGFSG
jgi:DNA-3-methyladenine glycosylase I